MGLERNTIPKDADVRTSFAHWSAQSVDLCDVARVTIDMLPDVVLLEIFHFYVDELIRREEWHALVHVCRKWRNVVFGSPRGLDLQLCCTPRTPVRKTLDVWPHLPIKVRVEQEDEASKMDNIIAVLEHNGRICKMEFAYSTPGLEKVLSAMQQPFPELTTLFLWSGDEMAVLPDSFLGGSAPRLRSLGLCSIPFPGLPRLLLSATHLDNLYLSDIPHSGYISPETMATCLSALTTLKSLTFEFESPRSCPDRKRRCPPPRTRTLLPVLTKLRFGGVSEYLEDFVARIDTPLLDELQIEFFHQLLFDTPQLTQFVSRTPTLRAYNEARVRFTDWDVWMTIPQTSNRKISLGIRCRKSDWQLSSVAQLCSSFFNQSLIPVIEQLYIFLDKSVHGIWAWPDEIESNQWLELLHQFPAAKGLYISQRCEPHIAPALQELVGGRVTEVLPALETLFVSETLSSGPVREAIGRFVVARQLTSHPIALSSWYEGPDE
jgi:F-box-like